MTMRRVAPVSRLGIEARCQLKSRFLPYSVEAYLVHVVKQVQRCRLTDILKTYCYGISLISKVGNIMGTVI